MTRIKFRLATLIGGAGILAALFATSVQAVAAEPTTGKAGPNRSVSAGPTSTVPQPPPKPNAAKTTDPKDVEISAPFEFKVGELFCNRHNYRACLILQKDGNLVLYNFDDTCPTFEKPLWASNTSGYPGSTAKFQNDGNLVVYHPNGAPLWASHTWWQPNPKTMRFQVDGNVVIYDRDKVAGWHTNTWNRCLE